MADNVNLKIKQSIGNVKLRNSSFKSKMRMRFILPANVIIKVKARQNIGKTNPETNTEATQSLKINNKEIKGESNDK